MEPEGMVHALEEIHRLLSPDGVLIDIHPYPKPSIVQVLYEDQVVFAKPKRELSDLNQEVIAADEALEEVVKRGVFDLERRENFDFYSYGATVPELRDFWLQYNEYDDSQVENSRQLQAEAAYAEAEGVRQAIGDDAEAAIHERTKIARLIPMKGDK